MADPNEAGVDPHQQRDRDGAEHRKGAPWATHQRLDYDQRQNGEQNDHDQQHTDERDAAGRRSHLRAHHVAERAAVAPGGEEENGHVLHRAGEDDAG